jgi:hypothetical protein
MSIDAQNIIRITEAGLFYIDENSREVFIDFSACYTNYWTRLTEKDHLQRFQQINGMGDDQLAAWLKRHEAWKEVAQRDITGSSAGINRPFIVFHTSPPVQFTFVSEDEFHRVRYAIERFGWRTSDLS